MHGLNITDCIEVIHSVDSLEFRMGSDVQSFKEFIKEHARLVTVDIFSTKDIAAKNPQFKDRYIELIRSWGVVNYSFIGDLGLKNKSIGFIDNAHLYNGFSLVMDSEKIIENPQKTFDEGLNNILSDKTTTYISMIIPPSTFARTKTYLLKDFYESYIREKVIGGK